MTIGATNRDAHSCLILETSLQLDWHNNGRKVGWLVYMPLQRHPQMARQCLSCQCMWRDRWALASPHQLWSALDDTIVSLVTPNALAPLSGPVAPSLVTRLYGTFVLFVVPNFHFSYHNSKWTNNDVLYLAKLHYLWYICYYIMFIGYFK